MLLLTLQTYLVLVASLIGTSRAAPTEPVKAIDESLLRINLAKRGRASHLIPGTELLDFVAFTKHVKGVKAKYAMTKANYEANHGLTKRGSISSIPLFDQKYGAYWSGSVNFGGQSLMIDFDTGSADTLLDGDTYTPSPKATKTGKTFRNAYGTKSANDAYAGRIYQDTFSSGNLSVSKASIGKISRGGEIVPAADGLVGLSYPSLSSFGSEYPPLFDVLMRESALSQNVFGFALSPDQSSLTLGGFDKSMYTGKISYVPVYKKAFWALRGSVNGQMINSAIDTGTTTILGPLDQVSRFFSSLKGVTQFGNDGDLYGAYECDTPPRITFKYGSTTIALTRAATQFGKTTDGRCVLSIVGTEIGEDHWITGDPLFLSSYVAFSREKNAVGFAQRT